ncbi:MAG: hypothetical protein WC916_03760 [Candidatus Woesearchaeota archaeon]
MTISGMNSGSVFDETSEVVKNAFLATASHHPIIHNINTMKNTIEEGGAIGVLQSMNNRASTMSTQPKESLWNRLEKYKTIASAYHLSELGKEFLTLKNFWGAFNAYEEAAVALFKHAREDHVLHIAEAKYVERQLVSIGKKFYQKHEYRLAAHAFIDAYDVLQLSGLRIDKELKHMMQSTAKVLVKFKDRASIDDAIAIYERTHSTRGLAHAGIKLFWTHESIASSIDTYLRIIPALVNKVYHPKKRFAYALLDGSTQKSYQTSETKMKYASEYAAMS